MARFLTVAPLPLAPLIAAPLADLTGVLDHPLLYAVPTTGANPLTGAALATAFLARRTLRRLGVLRAS